MDAQSLTLDAGTIAAWLAIFIEPGQITELRALNIEGKTHSGYFGYERLHEMAEHAISFSGRASGVYFVPNPINPEFGKNPNVRVAAQLTKDVNIIRRKWMLVDFDPVRPANRSASDAEKENARDIMESCAKVSVEQWGWHVPVKADSGNGFHLCYPVDMANDERAKLATQRSLHLVRKIFQTVSVKVDTGIYNAARIWKLYGTVARKGESTTERPHRVSTILESNYEPHRIL